MAKVSYEDSVFINCPFDDAYQALFHAIIFAVHDCGFVSRCALEVKDSSENRLSKIQKIIEESKYGIHDISRTEVNQEGLPRFNMPLELGLFLGCKAYGTGRQKQKNALILDKERFRYHRFISDLAGNDPEEHEGNEEKAICRVRDWLNAVSRRRPIPSGDEIANRFRTFQSELPAICQQLKQNPTGLDFIDYQYIVVEWLRANMW